MPECSLDAGVPGGGRIKGEVAVFMIITCGFFRKIRFCKTLILPAIPQVGWKITMTGGSEQVHVRTTEIVLDLSAKEIYVMARPLFFRDFPYGFGHWLEAEESLRRCHEKMPRG